MSVKQLMPRRLRPRAREAIRRLSGQHPLVPPRLHTIGDGDFIEEGRKFLPHFVNLGGLKPTDRVLDVGSGTGRMAVPLTGYLKSGTYDGIEIVRNSVEWCQKAYRRHRNFRFHHSDIYNKHYNENGVLKAAEYKFPFPSGSFDFVFLSSVFTHMLTVDIENYLREIARVLSPGGTALMTAFLLNAETEGLIKEGRSYYRFTYEIDGARVESIDVPEKAIAFDEERFLAMIRSAGLQAPQAHLGHWRGAGGACFQDIIVARSQG